jgi:LPXTG-site transpeptidase (sortase) family protein
MSKQQSASLRNRMRTSPMARAQDDLVVNPGVKNGFDLARIRRTNQVRSLGYIKREVGQYSRNIKASHASATDLRQNFVHASGKAANNSVVSARHSLAENDVTGYQKKNHQSIDNAKFFEQHLTMQRRRPQKSKVLHRIRPEFTSQKTQQKVQKLKTWISSQLPQSKLMTGMAAFVFLFGLAVSLHTLLTNQNVSEQVQAITNDADPDNNMPSEEEVSEEEVRAYTVAPDMPRYIRIQKLGVVSRVFPMGVTEDNQLKAPSNIFDVGWYNKSAKPGKNGTALMDAHVSGPTRGGAFHGLKRLEKGDIIEVERGDGAIFRYSVVAKEAHPVKDVDMAKALVSIEPGKNGLNLITCDGPFNAQTNDYPDRLVVYAVEI